MTLLDITKQLHNMTKGNINSMHFTQDQLKNYIYKMVKPYIPFLMEVSLPDGKWYCFIMLTKEHCYDYQIAETREEEQHMLNIFFANKKLYVRTNRIKREG